LQTNHKTPELSDGPFADLIFLSGLRLYYLCHLLAHQKKGWPNYIFL
jgi:hypothetical protein